MPLFAALAGSAIGAGLNLLTAAEERRNLEKQKSQLNASKLNAAERAKLLRNLDRGFNANISNDMNKMALTTRGADASLAKAAALGNAEGARITAKSDLYGKMLQYNKGIQAQIAGLGDVNYSNAIFTGAIEGGIAGNQIGQLKDESKKVTEDKVIGEGLGDGTNSSAKSYNDGLTPEYKPSGVNTYARDHVLRDNINSDPYNDAAPVGDGVKTTSDPIKESIYKGPSRDSFDIRQNNLDSMPLNLTPENSYLNSETSDLGNYLGGQSELNKLGDAWAPWEAFGAAKGLYGIAKYGAGALLNETTGRYLGKALGGIGKAIKPLAKVGKNIGKGVEYMTPNAVQDIGRAATKSFKYMKSFGSTMDDVANEIPTGFKNFAEEAGRMGRSSKPSALYGQSDPWGPSSNWNPVKRYVSPNPANSYIPRTSAQKLLDSGESLPPNEWINRMIRPWLRGKAIKGVQ